MTGRRPSGPDRSGWWLLIATVPVLCCAGPAVLAVLGVGSVGAAVGGNTGNAALVVVGVLMAAAALLLAGRRGGQR